MPTMEDRIAAVNSKIEEWDKKDRGCKEELLLYASFLLDYIQNGCARKGTILSILSPSYSPFYSLLFNHRIATMFEILAGVVFPASTYDGTAEGFSAGFLKGIFSYIGEGAEVELEAEKIKYFSHDMWDNEAVKNLSLMEYGEAVHALIKNTFIPFQGVIKGTSEKANPKILIEYAFDVGAIVGKEEVEPLTRSLLPHPENFPNITPLYALLYQVGEDRSKANIPYVLYKIIKVDERKGSVAEPRRVDNEEEGWSGKSSIKAGDLS